ncbi:MAG: methyltransferase domain-containing protein [Phycisphaerales bacterium]
MPTIDINKKRLTRITCAKHVTPYLREEVAALGFEIQDEHYAGVYIGATLDDCMRLNLHLRTALHVMWLLKRFRCPSPKALYTHGASFAWEELIPNDSFFTVTSHVDHPKVTNSMYPNLVLKDAIVDRISKRTGARPDSGSDRSKIVIHLYWKDDRAWLYLNTTGRRLSNRGYRKMPHAAPMQETLAAAVLMALGYDGTVPLVNPMCGSGTLPIEAALIATGRAPGLLRTNYSFMHTKLHDDDAFRRIRNEAREQRRSQPPASIVASDIDPRAVKIARKNAQTAGVEQLIDFVECDFAETPLPDQSGIVVLNPEYGERLGDRGELELVYARIGDFLKQRCPGWRGYVFTGNRDLSKRIGLRVHRRIPFMNAKIECRLLEYELYQGSLER